MQPWWAEETYLKKKKSNFFIKTLLNDKAQMYNYCKEENKDILFNL